jgi:hypothetical protein
MREKKAAEPQKMELPSFATEKSQLETIDVISDDQTSFDEYWNELAEKLEVLEQRADKPMFLMENRSIEFNAMRNEVNRLANTGCTYLRLAYLKYLSAAGFSIDDANLLVDNVEGPCRSNIFKKVQHAQWALDTTGVIVL